ncbi:hypothetical protein BJF86_08405 [Serinicoccus sp. CNJ-927]|nr:hypothetical protein BJF86_08405 [Serinicoccus sp. CNJ-927]
MFEALIDRRRVSRFVSDGLADLAPENALPIRQFLAWKGKRNYEGRYFSATSGGHVVFESLLERDFLITVDADPDVLAVSAQPFLLIWPRGTGKEKFHYPDFFLRLRDGGARVVDVRHPERTDTAEKQFAMTRQVCESAGWDYDVWTGLPEPRMANLRWLHGYRLERYAPHESLRSTILDTFSPGTELAAGLRRATRVSAVEKNAVHAAILHLLFFGVIHVDLDKPLSMDSHLSTREIACAS